MAWFSLILVNDRQGDKIFRITLRKPSSGLLRWPDLVPAPEHLIEYYKTVAQPERILRTRQEVAKFVFSSSK